MVGTSRGRNAAGFVRLVFSVAIGAALLGAIPRTDWAAESGSAPKVDRAALQSDADVLVAAYKRLHPGLYRYNTPAQFDSRVRDLHRALDRAGDLRQAFIAFSEFAATIRCGHTYLNPTNQPESIQHALLEGDDRVPFEFRWVGRRMYVTRDL